MIPVTRLRNDLKGEMMAARLLTYMAIAVPIGIVAGMIWNFIQRKLKAKNEKK